MQIVLLTNWLFFEISQWRKDILLMNYCIGMITIQLYHFIIKNILKILDQCSSLLSRLFLIRYIKKTCILTSWAFTIATCKRAFHTMLLATASLTTTVGITIAPDDFEKFFWGWWHICWYRQPAHFSSFVKQGLLEGSIIILYYHIILLIKSHAFLNKERRWRVADRKSN